MIGTKVIHKGKEIELTLEREEVYDFLVNLRDSGVTNMWGAAPYIASYFGCDRHESSYWLVEWIKSFKSE